LGVYFVDSSRYAIKSARSCGFLMPAKTIFVPGMYFFGFSRYSNNVSLFQVIPTQEICKVHEESNIKIHTVHSKKLNITLFYKRSCLFSIAQNEISCFICSRLVWVTVTCYTLMAWHIKVQVLYLCKKCCKLDGWMKD
jgi:hypothetical protein